MNKIININTNKLLLAFTVLILSACSSAPPPKIVFSILLEPGFDGYYVQNSENKFLPLDVVSRTSFKENVQIKDVKYIFCETYTNTEFLKVTQLNISDYQLNAVKGNSGRDTGGDYRLYKMDRILESKAPTETVKICAKEVKSKLAVHGGTIKLKAVEPLSAGLYYLKDKIWFINKKSRLFILN